MHGLWQRAITKTYVYWSQFFFSKGSKLDRGRGHGLKVGAYTGLLQRMHSNPFGRLEFYTLGVGGLLGPDELDVYYFLSQILEP